MNVREGGQVGDEEEVIEQLDGGRLLVPLEGRELVQERVIDIVDRQLAAAFRAHEGFHLPRIPPRQHGAPHQLQLGGHIAQLPVCLEHDEGVWDGHWEGEATMDRRVVLEGMGAEKALAREECDGGRDRVYTAVVAMHGSLVVGPWQRERRIRLTYAH